MVVCMGECMCTQRVDITTTSYSGWMESLKHSTQDTGKKCMVVCMGDCMCTQRVNMTTAYCG